MRLSFGPGLWTLVCALTLSWGVPGWTMSSDEVLDKLERAQSLVKSLSAQLEETIVMKGSLQGQAMTGRLIWSQPNNIHLQFEKPTAQTIVCDGKLLWVYTPALNQVLRQDMQSSDLLKQFQFQLGQEVKQMRERFTVTLQGQERLEGAVCHILKMVPKQKKGFSRKGYYEVKLWVSEASWIPVKSMATMGVGSQLVLRLKGLKVNPAVAPGLFNFKPPSWTEVMDGMMLLAPGSMDGGKPVKP